MSGICTGRRDGESGERFLWRRYFLEVGSIPAHAERLSVYQVVETDEVPDEEMIAVGYTPIPPDISDEEVEGRFWVSTIHVVHDVWS
jgi:hypothetical protein